MVEGSVGEVAVVRVRTADMAARRKWPVFRREGRGSAREGRVGELMKGAGMFAEGRTW